MLFQLCKEKGWVFSFSSSSLIQKQLDIDTNLCFCCLRKREAILCHQQPLVSGFKCQVHFSIERKKLRQHSKRNILEPKVKSNNLSAHVFKTRVRKRFINRRLKHFAASNLSNLVIYSHISCLYV